MYLELICLEIIWGDVGVTSVGEVKVNGNFSTPGMVLDIYTLPW